MADVRVFTKEEPIILKLSNQGPAGSSILSVTKVATDDLVDTYRGKMTDGVEFFFKVRNGYVPIFQIGTVTTVSSYEDASVEIVENPTTRTITMNFSLPRGADGNGANAIAPNFNVSTSYSSGDYVIYDGAMYRFNTAHTGSWDDEHADVVNVGEELEDKLPLTGGTLSGNLTISSTSVKRIYLKYGSYNSSSIYTNTNGFYINTSRSPSATQQTSESATYTFKTNGQLLLPQPLTVVNGGTGGNTAMQARSSLGVNMSYSNWASDSISLANNTDTNVYNLTLPTGGYYIFNFTGVFNANATGDRIVKICSSGTTNALCPACQSSVRATTASNQTITGFCFPVPIESGTTIDMYAKQTSGGALSATFYLCWIRLQALNY